VGYTQGMEKLNMNRIDKIINRLKDFKHFPVDCEKHLSPMEKTTLYGSIELIEHTMTLVETLSNKAKNRWMDA